VRRAPRFLAKLGLEWLWRIKEEPHLWTRYGWDGLVLLRLLLARLIPLALTTRLRRLRAPADLGLVQTRDGEAVTINLIGDATAAHVDKAVAHFRGVTDPARSLTLDLSATRAIDARFFGLLLMLRKQLNEQGAALTFRGVSARMVRTFRRHGVPFLLLAEDGG
jgi:N-acetylglucosaminyldiphosphoundecaprenol N-acetyl-beta-D-mannosaminyltransferase